MGQGYTFRCEQCEYSIEYLQGVGFMFYKEAEDILSDMKAGKMGKGFMEAANNAATPTINHSRELYRCMKCGELRPDMKIALCDGEAVIKEKQHVCGKCRSKMRVVKNIEKVKCPHCGKKLELAGILMWD